MYSRLVIDGNAVYEIDEECIQKKKNRGFKERKSKKELEHALHNKNILEQRKKLVERKERSHRLIVKGAEFEKAFPLSRDLEQEEVQDVMKQLQNSSYNKSIVRQVHIAALHKEQQQIAEAVEKAERGDDG